MVDLAEEVDDVELHHEHAAPDEARTEPLHRLRRRPLGTEPERDRQKVSLVDGFQHQLGGLPSHTITDPGYPQRTLATLWFRDIHTPGRRGTITTCAEITLKFP
jgi:hypothetical protein